MLAKKTPSVVPPESEFRDDEPTQVTGILDELRNSIAESEKCAKDVESKADRARRLLRRRKSSEPVIRALSEHPAPSESAST